MNFKDLPAGAKIISPQQQQKPPENKVDKIFVMYESNNIKNKYYYQKGKELDPEDIQKNAKVIDNLRIVFQPGIILIADGQKIILNIPISSVLSSETVWFKNELQMKEFNIIVG